MSIEMSLRGLVALVPAFLGAFTADALAEAPFPCLDQPVLASVELRGPWQFRFDPADEGALACWYGAITNGAQWESITIPRVWNIPDGAVSGLVAQAVGWYQLRVPVPRTWDQDVSLAGRAADVQPVAGSPRRADGAMDRPERADKGGGRRKDL